VQGLRPHDPGQQLYGGVAGHAGLFLVTANDLAVMMQLMRKTKDLMEM